MRLMTPEQAKGMLHAILPVLKMEVATTYKVIHATPDDHLDYRPSDRCMPAGELVWHIASAEMMFLNCIASGDFKFGGERPANTETPSQIAEWYKHASATAVARIEAMSGEELAKPMDFRGMMTMPAVGFITFSMHHIIHHRGQLSSYIRPMGGHVPSIYGPSADDNPFAAKA